MHSQATARATWFGSMPERSDDSMMSGVRQLVLALIGRPNGLPISRRERVIQTVKKPTISRAAVGCMGVFGAPVAFLRVVSRMRRPHLHRITPGITGVLAEPHPAQNHACITGVLAEPRPAGITFSTTSLQHTGPAYHACTTCLQHNERSYHTLHNGRWHDGAGTTGVQEAQFATSPSKTECQPRAPDAERFGIQLPRARWVGPLKNQRSRARSGQLQCRVRRSGIHRSSWQPHAPTTPSGDHALHNGRSVGITPIWDHPRHNGRPSEPPAAPYHARHNGRSVGTTPGTTGFPHNGLPYHPRHHGPSARRACVSPSAQRAPARRERHDGRSGSTIRRIISKKGCEPHSPDAERFAYQLPRARCIGSPQKRTISRAQRSAA